jgi:hypothetical protein
MSGDFLSTTRVAGLLMLLSPLLMMIAVAVIAAQGKLGGMAAAFGGEGLRAGDPSGLRIIGRFAIPAQIVLIAGLAFFSVLLYEAGDRGAAVAGLALVVLSAAVGALESAFSASVTVWAADQASRTGAAPEFFEPLRRWASGEVQLVWVSAFLSAMVLFSLSALRTGLLSSWIGWAALGWSLLAFPLYFLVLGAPLIVFLSPLLFGIGMLLRG